MPTPPSPPEIGIIVALPMEAACLGVRGCCVGASRNVGNMRVFVAGIGGDPAAAAARQLVRHGARVLLSWGVAGGLSPALAPGELLIAAQVVTRDGCWDADDHWLGRVEQALHTCVRHTHTGRLWCDEQVVCSIHAKRQLALRGLLAVDMESAAVARVAADAGIPFVAVKSICDPFNRALPAAALQLLDARGRLRLRALASVLRGGPATWRALRVLRGDFTAARRGLRRAAAALPALAAT